MLLDKAKPKPKPMGRAAVVAASIVQLAVPARGKALARPKELQPKSTTMPMHGLGYGQRGSPTKPPTW